MTELQLYQVDQLYQVIKYIELIPVANSKLPPTPAFFKVIAFAGIDIGNCRLATNNTESERFLIASETSML